MRYNIDSMRHVEPRTPDELWNWIYLQTGVRIARNAVCDGHHAPFDALSCMQLTRPPAMLTLGSRGSGKSFGTAIDSHLCSRFEPRHKTRILGGAKSQAKQVQSGIVEAVIDGRGPYGGCDKDQIDHAGVEKFTYINGAEIEILTASTTSVRGPHVPSLKVDEVDEIDPELREAAMGMVMDKENFSRKSDVKRRSSMVSYTSTWHNLGGPMEEVMALQRESNNKNPGSFPFFHFCLFDVLRKCPEEISGNNLEFCPSCPLMPYCHEDKDRHGGVPKAKRGNGHYSVRDAIQKMQNVSTRTFEADYLCRGVKAEGLIFPEFNELNVTEKAEYKPHLPVHLALDNGLHTAAIFFQIEKLFGAGYEDYEISVFADYYSEGQPPEVHADAVRSIANARCNGRIDYRWTDSAGEGRNNTGTVLLGEYEKFGLDFKCWPKKSIKDGLAFIEGLILSADKKRRLIIHSRCNGEQSLGQAFRVYKRKKIRGCYLDEPEEPHRPHYAEDLMDSLRGGLIANFPEGRLPQPNFRRVPARKVF